MQGNDDIEAGDVEVPAVSRETTGRLQEHLNILGQWQKTHNLVASSTLPELWSRHVLDSLRLWPAVEAHWQRGALVDLGSGAGFPGVVLAVMAQEAGAAVRGPVHLVESNGKKASFLRHVARVLELDVVIHPARIQDAAPQLAQIPIDVVTARALAPLDRLLTFAEPLLIAGATGIFPKGARFEVEVAAARRYWNFGLDLCRKKPDEGDVVGRSGVGSNVGPILIVSNLVPKASVGQ
jgi:16S rRNA (guanine527-N7)-methyltransferase